MKRAQRPWALFTLLVLGLMALPLPPLSADNTPDGTVVVRMPAAAYAAVEIPAVRALPYGSFVWLELTDAAFARLQASGQPYQMQPDPFTLTLGEQRFDPGRGDPELPAGWRGAPGDGADLYLVQLAGPTDAQWLAGLRQSGLASCSTSTPSPMSCGVTPNRSNALPPPTMSAGPGPLPRRTVSCRSGGTCPTPRSVSA